MVDGGWIWSSYVEMLNSWNISWKFTHPFGAIYITISLKALHLSCCQVKATVGASPNGPEGWNTAWSDFTSLPRSPRRDASLSKKKNSRLRRSLDFQRNHFWGKTFQKTNMAAWNIRPFLLGDDGDTSSWQWLFFATIVLVGVYTWVWIYRFFLKGIPNETDIIGW